jgi:hypothetical protein
VADYEFLRRELTLRGPAGAEAVAWLRDEFGPQLPTDYLAFIGAHDGGEGPVGSSLRAGR